MDVSKKKRIIGAVAVGLYVFVLNQIDNIYILILGYALLMIYIYVPKD